jgi:hypothetical protein
MPKSILDLAALDEFSQISILLESLTRKVLQLPIRLEVARISFFFNALPSLRGDI